MLQPTTQRNINEKHRRSLEERLWTSGLEQSHGDQHHENGIRVRNSRRQHNEYVHVRLTVPEYFDRRDVEVIVG